MAGKTISVGDFTGKQRASLDRKRAKAKQAREGQITTITNTPHPLAPQTDQGVTDLTGQRQDARKGRPEAAPQPVLDEQGREILLGDPTLLEIAREAGAAIDPDDLHVDASQEGPTIATYPDVIVKAMADMSEVTIGVGTEYNFEYGRKYKVPYNVAFHLAEQGYVEVLDKA